MNNRIQRGNVAELAVASEASKRGYVVCLPISHNSHYDLIIDNGTLNRIQVKRVYKVNNHGSSVRCVEGRRIHSKQRWAYPEDSYDFLLACDVDTNDIWIIPFETTAKYKAQIYLDSKEEYRNQWSLLGYEHNQQSETIV